MADKKYDGWANYETWSIALFIDNDESIYNQKEEAKKRFLKENIEEAPYNFSKWLEDFAYDFLDFENLNPMQQQMLKASFDEVDFIEIANTYLKES